MSDELKTFVNELVKGNSGISAIWLIGSRANNTAKALSDWDILVFGDAKTFSDLKENEFFHRGAVDLLVVKDGGDFERPYGRAKSGSLSKWRWKETSSNEAEYEGIKFIPDEIASDLGELDKKVCKAKLLYRKPK